MNKRGYLLPKLPGDPLRVLRVFTVEGLRKKQIRLNEGSEGTFVKMETVGMPSAALLDQMGLGAYDTPRYIANFPEGPIYLEEADFQFKYVERPLGVRNLMKTPAPTPGATPDVVQQSRKERLDEIRQLRRLDQRYAKLMSRQEAILKKYLAEAGSRAVSDFDDLPANVRAALMAVKDQETLWSDVNRWLNDNNNPNLRSASQGEPIMSLHREIQRVAAEYPETRKHLVHLLRKFSDENVVACTCPDGGKSAADGDELLGGRTWGNPDPYSKPDDKTPYHYHEDSPPAGADGSAQRKKYNEWFRENVCPKHKTTCGAPWLAK